MALKFSSIKSLFVVDEEEENAPASKVSEKTSTEKEEKTQESKISWKSSSKTEQTSSVNIPETPITPTNTVASEGAHNQKIFESLTKAISDANLPGEDYLEYMEAFRAMKDLPLDESVKIQTTLATLSTKGLTKQKVYESADYYISILENEKRKFYTAFDSQAKGGVAKKKQEILNLEKENKDKIQLIAKLNQEIKINEDKIRKINIEISQAESKHKKTENDFNFTYNKILNRIKSDIQKIKSLN